MDPSPPAMTAVDQLAGPLDGHDFAGDSTPSSPLPPAGTDLPYGRWRLAVIWLTFLVVMAIGIPHLPAGICFGDEGDLQAACSFFGIAHPPGYIGFAGAGFLLVKMLFFLEPAFAVSLLCLACLAVSLSVLAAVLMRLGVHPCLAGAASLLLLCHRMVWRSAVAPEVYAPALALMAGVVWFMVRYERRRERWSDLSAAARLWGFLLINRPPALFFLPGLALPLLPHARTIVVGRPVMVWSRFWRRLGVAGGSAALVSLMLVVLMGIRDGGGARYNYIQQHVSAYDIPEGEPGGWSRLSWQLSGAQFRNQMGADWQETRQKFRWLRTQLHIRGTLPMLLVVLLLIAGSIRMFQRSPSALIMGWGLLLGAIGFVLQYRLCGQTADLLPILWTGALLMGGFLIPGDRDGVLPVGLRRWLFPLAFAGVVVGSTWHSCNRPCYARQVDAAAYVQRLSITDLPQHAVICAVWDKGPVLWYEVLRTGRHDVEVMVAGSDRWPAFVARAGGRAVYYADDQPPPDGYITEESLGLYRLRAAPHVLGEGEREPLGEVGRE